MARAPNGAALASGGDDGTVRLRDPAGRARATFIDQASWGGITAPSWSPGSAILAGGAHDGNTRLWR